MLRFYGIDIGDWWRGDLSSRRLLALVDSLPEDSATFRARNTGDRWTETQHMLAYLIDQVTFTRREAQSSESTWSPKPFPRPDDGEEEQEKQQIMSSVHDGLLALMSGSEPPQQFT